MKKIIFALIIVFTQTMLFVGSSISQSGWNLVYTASQTLNSVHFVNASTGYAVGMSGVVIKTTDGGNNWLNIPVVSVNNHFRGVFFTNANTGTIVGDLGAIYRTTNGGSNWNYQTNPIGNYSMNNVYFINADTGCIVGFSAIHQNGIIMMTTNGGDVWMNRSYTHDASYNDAYFFNQNTGFVVGQYPDIIRTSDACLTWTIRNAYSIVYGISFSDTNRGVCVGSNGKLLMTSNSGNNWTVYNTGITNNLYGVSHGSRDAAVIVGSSGTILKTSNAGLNWFTQQSNLTTALRSVSFVNSSTGWAVGEAGKIIKTTDGGGTVGIDPINSEIPKDFLLSQNYPNPFNPTTSINFSIPKTTYITLTINDILGKQIAVLVNEQLKPGIYNVTFDGSNLPSGTYYYSMRSNNFSVTKKLVLIK